MGQPDLNVTKVQSLFSIRPVHMGCGNSKRQEPQQERRIRITDTRTHALDETTVKDAPPATAPRSSVVSVARSTQDGFMAEQESFAKSLPSESRFILNATMANMMDLGNASVSPSDIVDREPLNSSLRDGHLKAKPLISEIPIASLGNPRPVTPDEAKWVTDFSNTLCGAFKTVQINSTESIILPFLPLPDYE